MSDTKIITGKVRFGYVHVFEPRAMEEGDPKKYSVCIIIPKSDKNTLDRIHKAVKAATLEGKSSKFGGKIPKNLKTPLRDGDEEREDMPEFEGCYFMNANSNRKPGLIYRDKSEIYDDDDFYSGVYGRASVNFFAYSGASKGIACGLNSIQKLEDGERLSGNRVSAAEDFGDDFEDDFEDDFF